MHTATWPPSAANLCVLPPPPARSRPISLTPEQEVAERVFQQAYIPKKLEEVVHYERDHERLQAGTNTGG